MAFPKKTFIHQIVDIPAGSFSKLNDVLRLAAIILNDGTAIGISAEDLESPVFSHGQKNAARNAAVDYRSGQSLNEDAEGGVPQKEAYAVSDLLLNRASIGKSEQDYILILQEGITQFIRLVKKYKDTSHHSLSHPEM